MKRSDITFKLEEAEFFLDLLKESYDCDPKCKFVLGAFLSAARSVIEYHDKYTGIGPSSDAEIKFLIDARNQDVHQEPPKTETTSGGRLANIVVLVKAGEEPPPEIVSGEKAGKTISNPQKIRWVFRDSTDAKFPLGSNPEVIAFCERQLCKLKTMVQKL